jgi:hypothetical protein
MQTTLDVPATVAPVISQEVAQRTAQAYVIDQIGASFQVSTRVSYDKRNYLWRFLIQCQFGPLHAIEVDAQNGKVIALTESQVRLVRQRAAIAAARRRNILPVDEHDHVLAEYARRSASRYLDAHLSMYFSAAGPVFVPGEPPRWQVAIVFQNTNIGPLILGVMDVDAHTGEPEPLTDEMIQQLRERTSAIIGHQTQAATAG